MCNFLSALVLANGMVTPETVFPDYPITRLLLGAGCFWFGWWRLYRSLLNGKRGIIIGAALILVGCLLLPAPR